MRFLLLAAVLFASSCGSESSKPSVQTSQVISKGKEGPVDVLSDSVINKFLALNEALIGWDSTKVEPLASRLIQSMDDLKTGLSKDSTAAIQQLDLSKKEMQRLNAVKSLMDKRLVDYDFREVLQGLSFERELRRLIRDRSHLGEPPSWTSV